MIEHTKGPWKMFEVNGTVGIVGPRSDIAYTKLPEIVSDSSRSIDEDRANAILMATAPELLDACRRAVCALAYASKHDKIFNDDYEVVSSVIAKATGASE
jgi:hypothetical protein